MPSYAYLGTLELREREFFRIGNLGTVFQDFGIHGFRLKIGSLHPVANCDCSHGSSVKVGGLKVPSVRELTVPFVLKNEQPGAMEHMTCG
ncbi:hypothetical protein SADUNF_Sadunf12G0018000 [Salix dunnii]|uniref:Uncharacterized protein n=1 Tax=Salix dunnii TaxID=1413687 RepID=A0A835JMI3_9ROSI|nr:hypothetical protein SADUNF_Sadunf12G0018000 [Salix dunnii]